MKKQDYARDRILRHRREHQNERRRYRPHRRVRTREAMEAARQRSRESSEGVIMDSMKAVAATLTMRRFFAGKKLEGLKGHRQSRGKDRGH